MYIFYSRFTELALQSPLSIQENKVWYVKSHTFLFTVFLLSLMRFDLSATCVHNTVTVQVVANHIVNCYRDGLPLMLFVLPSTCSP